MAAPATAAARYRCACSLALLTLSTAIVSWCVRALPQRIERLKSTESRMPISTLRSATRAARAVLLTTGIVLSVPFAAWAQSPASAQEGLCRVATVQGQHVQPSPKCHLPPPLRRNPASIENTTRADRDEIDRIAAELLRQSTAGVEDAQSKLSTIRPSARSEMARISEGRSAQ